MLPEMTSGRAELPSAIRQGDRRRWAAPDWFARVPGAVGVGALCLAVEAFLNAILLHGDRLTGDEPYYERIATHPAGPHTFPYAFRIGAAYLVHLLPFSHSVSWQLLALVAGAVAAGALFALLREFAVDPRLALALAVGFSISPNLLVVLLRDGRSVDPSAIMVITLGCLFIVRRQRLALALTLLVGATVHESCLFLIPLGYAVWAERPRDRDALRDVALVAVVPCLFYLYLRASIVTVGKGYQSGSFLSARVAVLRAGLGDGAWRLEARRMLLALGPMWVAAPFALRESRFARRGLVLVVCCFGSLTIALDWGRLVFFAAPVFYVAGAQVLKNRRRLAIAAVIVLFAVDIGYAVYMQVHGVRYGLDTQGIPTGPTI